MAVYAPEKELPPGCAHASWRAEDDAAIRANISAERPHASKSRSLVSAPAPDSRAHASVQAVSARGAADVEAVRKVLRESEGDRVRRVLVRNYPLNT